MVLICACNISVHGARIHGMDSPLLMPRTSAWNVWSTGLWIFGRFIIWNLNFDGSLGADGWAVGSDS
jgi:hypothetical protein